MHICITKIKTQRQKCNQDIPKAALALTFDNIFDIPDLQLTSVSRNAYIHKYIIGYYNTAVRITTKILTPIMVCALISYMSVDSEQ